ncbi:hypothetical protein C2845_PM14G06540 [Panicum miliaceum]|uniref:Uncharacterized protein n=1 Tax=Panicum miliaceum TaxID=4540 RepID=A0A3L6PRN0_PANMI|nr:hypothetical protein C2845_PM14G06540 [Panicum miliaceum]
MAVRASSISLVVLCFASLLLISSFAAETSGAHDAAGRKMKRGLLAADENPPLTYGGGPPAPEYPTSYGTPSPPVPTYTPTQP